MPDRPDPPPPAPAGAPASPARSAVLARVRAALAGDLAGDLADDLADEAGRDHADGRPAAPAPVRDYRRAGTTDPEALVAQLAERLTDYRARVHHCQLTAALAGTGTIVVPADLPEQWYAGFTGRVRLDRPADPVPVSDLDAPGVSVLTGCAVAIAETGTIVLDTGPGQGRRVLTLVPDHHICVVRVDQIVATVPEGLARLPDPTRPLTFISGPSATSDIELNRIEGVHGPRRLDVIIGPATSPPLGWLGRDLAP